MAYFLLFVSGWGALLAAGYGLVRGAELGLAWWRWQRRVHDAHRRNAAVTRRAIR
jgi:hypothetical protein